MCADNRMMRVLSMQCTRTMRVLWELPLDAVWYRRHVGGSPVLVLNRFSCKTPADVQTILVALGGSRLPTAGCTRIIRLPLPASYMPIQVPFFRCLSNVYAYVTCALLGVATSPLSSSSLDGTLGYSITGVMGHSFPPASLCFVLCPGFVVGAAAFIFVFEWACCRVCCYEFYCTPPLSCAYGISSNLEYSAVCRM
jgi:hypothetical protein